MNNAIRILKEHSDKLSEARKQNQEFIEKENFELYSDYEFTMNDIENQTRVIDEINEAILALLKHRNESIKQKPK